MRRLLTTLALAATVAAWSAPAAAAGFAILSSHTWEGIFTGSRLSGMGGADVAGDDGPGALLVNPAPLMRGNAVVVAYDHVDYPLSEVTSLVDADEDLDYVTTAVGVEWQGWRFSACISDESMDNSVMRTAYLPEGMGTLDHRSRMALVGLARQVAGNTRAGDMHAERGLQWTVGAAYRSYSSRTTDNRTDPLVTFNDGKATGTWDAGTTAAYRFADQAHQASIAATIAWQNLTDAKWVLDDREMDLPRVLRMGLTTGITFAEGPREWVKVVAAVARSDYASTSVNRDFSQLGIEVTALRVLALRVGSNDRFYGGSGTWGLGLVLDHPRGLPLEMAVDYGVISPDDTLYRDFDIAMWSGRVRVDF